MFGMMKKMGGLSALKGMGNLGGMNPNDLNSQMDELQKMAGSSSNPFSGFKFPFK